MLNRWVGCSLLAHTRSAVGSADKATPPLWRFDLLHRGGAGDSRALGGGGVTIRRTPDEEAHRKRRASSVRASVIGASGSVEGQTSVRIKKEGVCTTIVGV